ncbi:hypothetical protein [Nannocystis sp. SCPEA4]|uniref:hypothetical protein n=1 Tax=Nannocystis sp. SCPEA4 TaxID=2996787 RepID=UPI002272248F|nr:hypothetical protein [Nannocystis sp. SCPEA4]MCY1060183.1 hypothetical protein [Nannocystis sp. SCPEA4]
MFAGLSCRSSAECGSLVCVDEVCVDSTLDDSTSSGLAKDGPGGIEEDTDTDTDSAIGAGGEHCCEAMDILFVIDQSENMDGQCFEESLAVSVIGAQDELYAAIAGNIASFHVGFTTASIVPENPPGCQAMGSLLQGKPGDECFEEQVFGTPYLDERTDTPADFSAGVFCLTKAGTVSGGPSEQEDARPIEALLGAIEPVRSRPGGCNAGFSRREVPLLTVMFTNKDQADFIPAEEGSDPLLWQERMFGCKGFDFEQGRDRSGLIMVTGPDQPPDDPSICDAEAPGQLSVFYYHFREELRRRYDLCRLRPADVESGCSVTTAEELESFREFIIAGFNDMICELCAP